MLNSFTSLTVLHWLHQIRDQRGQEHLGSNCDSQNRNQNSPWSLPLFARFSQLNSITSLTVLNGVTNVLAIV